MTSCSTRTPCGWSVVTARLNIFNPLAPCPGIEVLADGDPATARTLPREKSAQNFVTHASALTEIGRNGARESVLIYCHFYCMSVGVSEAAERLGVSRQRVLQMIADQRLPAQRVGQSWSINEADIARRRVPVGRPLSMDMARSFLDLAAGTRPELSSRDISRLRVNMIRLVREVRFEGDPAGLLRSWLSASDTSRTVHRRSGSIRSACR